MPKCPSIIKSPALTLVGEWTSPDWWHRRLGHPSNKIDDFIIHHFSLLVVETRTPLASLCYACQCNKSHKLPFSSTSLISNHPLEYIYTDLPLQHQLMDFVFMYSLLIILPIYCWLFPIYRTKWCPLHFLSVKGFPWKTVWFSNQTFILW